MNQQLRYYSGKYKPLTIQDKLKDSLMIKTFQLESRFLDAIEFFKNDSEAYHFWIKQFLSLNKTDVKAITNLIQNINDSKQVKVDSVIQFDCPIDWLEYDSQI